MLPEILKIDFNAKANAWIIRLLRADGKTCQAQFTPDAFRNIRDCPMGQLLLHAWLSRARVVTEDQPNA